VRFRTAFAVLCCLYAAPQVASAAAAIGVTDTEILVGQSAAFSGPTAQLGEAVRDGAQVYFDLVNSQGGVHGRKIKLISLDDGAEPYPAVCNTRKLIDEHKVFALFGYVGTATSYVALPIVAAAKVPFFAPFTGADGVRKPFNKYVFNIRAGYDDETERLVGWLISQRKKKIALFYQNDSYGRAGYEGVRTALEKRKREISALGIVDRNTIDVESAVKTIAAVKPDAVVVVSDYKSSAAFVREMNKTGLRPEYVNVSFVGSAALAAELGAASHGVIISQTVPYPWDPSFSVAMEYIRLVRTAGMKVKPSFNNVEGFIAAKAFVEGLRRAGRELTREKFIASLETFDNVDLGNFYVSFSPTNHNGSKYVGMSVIIGSGGGFLPMPNKPTKAAAKSS
jgi:branched-chain amino acid transport system substrate-binding protein